ncbi:MAG: type II toxin-antitoxin system RelE/ParE family toxin [Chloroflexota bacterium]|nr:type II toxin-antitoxin system RelE/ParE family toxin [Chloroflexota bacterium]
MSYEVRIAKQAEAYFLRLDPRTRQRVLDRLRQIAQDPYGSHSKVLVNAGGRRASRVGDYRIVFAIDAPREIVRVSVIAPRGRAYRDL